MKQLTIILALITASSCCSAQTKHYLQQVLTNSTFSNFFNTESDNITLVEGEENEDSGLFIDAELEGYSSIYECNIKLTTNSYGRIDGIFFHFEHIKSIERYKGIISIFIEKNTGYRVTVPVNEDFSKKYNLISQQNRVDDMFVTGSIISHLNSFGQLTSLSNFHVNINFISTKL